MNIRVATGLAVVCVAMSVTGVSVAEPPPEGAASTEKVAKPKLYDESADAKAQIAAALARARAENRRVLIQWGGNWCPWCIRMAELMKSDKEIAKEVQYEYELVHADCGRNMKNVDLAEGYGAKVKESGFPYLTVLDAEGKAIANQETGTLEAAAEGDEGAKLKAGHRPEAVLGFLKKHQAAAVSAQGKVDAALGRAKSEGKRVFLRFGAPWCGWCHKLDEWLARGRVAEVLGKDFVILKVDTDRDTGGQGMLDAYSKGKSGGIPWFVFLDADGKAVVDSNGPKGNVGFPGTAEEIEWFGGMLIKSVKTMSTAEVEEVVGTLRKK